MPLCLCLRVPNRADDTCACPFFVICIDRLDVTTSPSRARRTIPEPCRSFLTRCCRLSFPQPPGLYLSVAAPSLPSLSPERWMILARVRSFMSIDRLDVTVSPSRASRTISEPCRSFLTRCCRLSFQQPPGLYLSVATQSMPSRPSLRR